MISLGATLSDATYHASRGGHSASDSGIIRIFSAYDRYCTLRVSVWFSVRHRAQFQPCYSQEDLLGRGSKKLFLFLCFTPQKRPMEEVWSFLLLLVFSAVITFVVVLFCP